LRPYINLKVCMVEITVDKDLMVRKVKIEGDEILGYR
jgi:hypothetical protein